MEETECGQNFDKKREEREIVGIVEIFKYPNLILQEDSARLGFEVGRAQLFPSGRSLGQEFPY